VHKEITEPDVDSLEANALEDWNRKNMEEIRAAVTRGAAGIEASYFCDHGVLLSLASRSS
jgi:hypothetical protein